VAWSEELADVVAKAHFCRVIVHRNSSRVTLVGRESDAKVAGYLIVVLMRAAEKIADAEYAKFFYECADKCASCSTAKADHRVKHEGKYRWSYAPTFHPFEPDHARARGFRVSFLTAFIKRLKERFDELEAEVARNAMALVRFDAAKAAVNEYIAGNTKPIHGLALRKGNTVGEARGRSAADSVSLRANAFDGKPTPKGALR